MKFATPRKRFVDSTCATKCPNMPKHTTIKLMHACVFSPSWLLFVVSHVFFIVSFFDVCVVANNVSPTGLPFLPWHLQSWSFGSRSTNGSGEGYPNRTPQQKWTSCSLDAEIREIWCEKRVNDLERIKKTTPDLGVSKNRGTPKSSILVGFSIINHPFWGTTIFGNTHLHVSWSGKHPGANAYTPLESTGRRWCGKPWDATQPKGISGAGAFHGESMLEWLEYVWTLRLEIWGTKKHMEFGYHDEVPDCIDINRKQCC